MLTTNSYKTSYMNFPFCFLLTAMLLILMPAGVHAEDGNDTADKLQISDIDVTLTPLDESETPYSVVVLKIDGPFFDKPPVDLFTTSDIQSPVDSIYEYAQLLTKLKKDKRVDALLLNFENPYIPWAHVDELRYHIEQFRKAGKKTYAYAESLTTMNYLLACHCDEVILTPTGNILLPGLGGQAYYYKDLLNKIGVQGDFIQMGRYKSAAESITRSGPSEADKEQLNSMLDSLYDHLLSSVAYSRGHTKHEIEAVVNQGFFTAEQALQHGLVNKIMYRKEFIASLEEQTGKNVALDLKYSEPRPIEINMDNPFSMLNLFQQMISTDIEPLGDAIAIMYLEGPITSGESEDGWSTRTVGSRTIRLALAKALRDPDIKAVVVRINSPGGSATASDIIYKAIKETAAEKPVVVSMGSVAASGGYYVACGAPIIMAEPSTITGSIGVIGGKLVLGGLFDKLGVNAYSFKRGKNSLLFNMNDPFTPHEREVFTLLLEDTYQTFKNRVASNRKDKLIDDIDNLAEGRVYTGKQAVKVGLIDKLGTLDEAVKLAAEKAEIEEYHIQVLPKPKTLFELLDDLLTVDTAADQPHRAYAGNIQNHLVQLLELLPGQPAETILKRSSIFYHLINREKCITMMPYDITLDFGHLMYY